MSKAATAPSQLDKFKQAAGEHGCYEDKARWDERLNKLVRQRPQPQSDED